jgi:hypothetical protein
MALALLTMCLGGCATAPSSPGACPHVKEYSKDVLEAAADEIDALPNGSVLGNVMMPDYGTLRAGARACWLAK